MYLHITREQWLSAPDIKRPKDLMPMKGRIYAKRRDETERWYETTHEQAKAGNWGHDMNTSIPLDSALSWICSQVHAHLRTEGPSAAAQFPAHGPRRGGTR